MTIPLDTFVSTPAARTIPRPANRDEWLAARRPWFNASAAATLFDEHPFTTLTDIVRAKLEPSVERFTGNAATRRGEYLEGAIAEWWSDEVGLAIYEPTEMYVNGPILATLDRRIVGNESECVEVKTTSKFVHGVERYWWWQVQAQCHAADLQAVHVVVLDASMKLSTYRIARDEEAIARLVERATEVMTYVNVDEWPPSVPQIRYSLPHTDRVVELDADTRESFTSWLAIREQLDELEAAEKVHKAALVAALGDAQAATIDGSEVLSYRAHTRRNIDLNRLRAEHADLAAELTTETLVRVLRPVTPRGVTR